MFGTVADVNVAKEKRRQGKQAQETSKTEFIYGYKMHNILNAQAEMITSIVVTAANRPNGKQFPELVRRNTKLELPLDIYPADCGYDVGENHYLLEICHPPQPVSYGEEGSEQGGLDCVEAIACLSSGAEGALPDRAQVWRSE